MAYPRVLTPEAALRQQKESRDFQMKEFVEVIVQSLRGAT